MANEKKNVTVSVTFLPELKNNGLWSEKDYKQIAKIRGQAYSHIKNVMEKQYTTTQETFDTILAYYVTKKENKLKEQELSSNG